MTIPANELGGKKHFGKRPVDLMESYALRALTKTEHLLLLRIEIELRRNAGRHNGILLVTKDDFVRFGISPRLIAAGLRALDALGIVPCHHGSLNPGGMRDPNRFLLNYDCGG